MAATATAAGGAADAARGHLQFVPIEEDAAPEGLDGSRVPFDGATELFKDGYTPLRDVGEEGAGTAAEAPEAHRSIILVTTAMFMGYAVLVSFQHNLKKEYNIADNSSSRSHEFSFAVSFLYIGNLIFRMAHNFIFAPIAPRNRVYVSMGAMAVSMVVLGIFVFMLNWNGTMAWIYVAYLLGGVGIGSFESNLLSAVTPLGHETKMWAIIGFPLGFASILVGAFSLTAVGVPPGAIYLGVLGLIIGGMTIFFYIIPRVEIANNSKDLKSFVGNLKQWQLWLPPIWVHSLALMVDMFAVSLFSGIMLYILNGSHVPLLSTTSDVLMRHDWFFVFYNSFSLMGDSFSRQIAYRHSPRHPFSFLLFSAAGAAFCLSKVPIVAPIGIFCVFFANGSIYATTTRFIDTHVAKEFNLIALSFWLFIGDIGSVIGSNVLPYIHDLVCKEQFTYICKSS